MTMICGCPRCATELSFSVDVADEATLQCPVCGGKFARRDAVARRAPAAVVVAPSSVPVASPLSLPTDEEPAADLLGDLSQRIRSLTARAASLSPTAARAGGDASEDQLPEAASERFAARASLDERAVLAEFGIDAADLALPSAVDEPQASQREPDGDMDAASAVPIHQLAGAHADAADFEVDEADDADADVASEIDTLLEQLRADAARQTASQFEAEVSPPAARPATTDNAPDHLLEKLLGSASELNAHVAAAASEPIATVRDFAADEIETTLRALSPPNEAMQQPETTAAAPLENRGPAEVAPAEKVRISDAAALRAKTPAAKRDSDHDFAAWLRRKAKPASPPELAPADHEQVAAESQVFAQTAGEEAAVELTPMPADAAPAKSEPALAAAMVQPIPPRQPALAASIPPAIPAAAAPLAETVEFTLSGDWTNGGDDQPAEGLATLTASTVFGNLAERVSAATAPAAGESKFEPVTLSAPIDLGRRRRRSQGSGLRTMVGVVLFGAVGTLAGGYILLWLKGPQSDLLHLASVLPDSMLPPAMRSTIANPEVQNGSPSVGEESLIAAEPRVEEQAPVDAVPLRQAAPDGNVAQASAVEPLATEHPPAPPEVAAAAAAAIGRPRSSIAGLAAAAATAKQALPELVAGDLATPESAGRTGRAYVALAQLAEQLTLLDPTADPNIAVTEQVFGKEVIARAVADMANPAVLSQVSQQWLGYGKRSTPGIVVTGTIRNVHARGPWTEYELELGAGEQARVVSVLCDEGRHQLGEAAAAAGVIVEDPRSRIADYDGDAPVVVFSRTLFRTIATPGVSEPPIVR